jgi:mannose-6-phosphate isomerase-like protein (cupin superfamily)
MDTITFEDYRAARLSEGYDEVAKRSWPPDAEVATHTHPFSVKARVVQGEMWLTVGDQTRHLRAGDSFELGRDAPHAERYGPSGATYWAARRHG